MLSFLQKVCGCDYHLPVIMQSDLRGDGLVLDRLATCENCDSCITMLMARMAERGSLLDMPLCAGAELLDHRLSTLAHVLLCAKSKRRLTSKPFECAPIVAGAQVLTCRDPPPPAPPAPTPIPTPAPPTTTPTPASPTSTISTAPPTASGSAATAGSSSLVDVNTAPNSDLGAAQGDERVPAAVVLVEVEKLRASAAMRALVQVASSSPYNTGTVSVDGWELASAVCHQTDPQPLVVVNPKWSGRVADGDAGEADMVAVSGDLDSAGSDAPLLRLQMAGGCSYVDSEDPDGNSGALHALHALFTRRSSPLVRFVYGQRSGTLAPPPEKSLFSFKHALCLCVGSGSCLASLDTQTVRSLVSIGVLLNYLSGSPNHNVRATPTRVAATAFLLERALEAAKHAQRTPAQQGNERTRASFSQLMKVPLSEWTVNDIEDVIAIHTTFIPKLLVPMHKREIRGMGVVLIQYLQYSVTVSILSFHPPNIYKSVTTLPKRRCAAARRRLAMWG